MKPSRVLLLVAALSLSTLVIGLLSPALGQQPSVTETFDDPALPGWDHSPNAAVVNGLLRIEPDGFAFLGGTWTDFSLSVRQRYTGEGHLLIHYRWSGETTYSLSLSGETVILGREQPGETVELGYAPASLPAGEWAEITVTVIEGRHQVAVNGSTLLSATDDAPLPEGGIGLRVEGMATGEFDDLVLTVEGGALPPPEPTAMPQPSPSAEAPPAPGVTTGTGLAWVTTSGPPGGLGYDIRYSFDDPNTWYVTDNYAGVHISADNGLTWLPSNTGIPGQLGPTNDWRPVFCLTVDPHNPQIIWAGTDKTGHIYRSSDGGSTWEQRDDGVTIEHDTLTFRGLTVDPRTSDIVYAMGETTDEALGGPAIWGSGTGGIVYKTVDGGLHWEKIWGDPPPSSLARYMWINPHDPEVLYVSTGIFDRGAVGEGDPATDPFGGLGILKSTDGGRTWRILGADNGLRMLYLGSLFMHPDNPDILLAAAGHVLDGGTVAYVEELMQAGDPLPSGVYRTADGGEHWTQVLISPPELAGQAFTSVELCPSDPSIAYAGSDQAIYRSQDAGQTWELVSGGQTGWGPPGVMAGWPIDMQCDPRDPDRIFANNYNGGNFLSEDGGRTWQNASNGYSGSQTRSVSVPADEPGRVYAAGRSGLWRSDDGGASWMGLYHPPPEKTMPGLEWIAVAADPSEPDHVLTGNGHALLESQDGGASWRFRGSLEEISDDPGEGPIAIVFAPSDPTTVYIGLANDCVVGHEMMCESGGAGVIISHDGGTTWERTADARLRGLGILDLAVDARDAATVYAATWTGLFKTSDGGAGWSALTGLPGDLPVRAVAVSPHNQRHVLAGVEGAGVYVSTDGGQSWQAGVAGLESNSSLHDILVDPVDPQVAYASDYFSGVYRSTDSGMTWTKINDGLLGRAAMGLTISGDGQHLYVAIDGNAVHRLDLNGQPPQSTSVDPVASPTARPSPIVQEGTPSAAQPAASPIARRSPTVQETSPPEAQPTAATPSGRDGLCPTSAILPLALLGAVWVSRRRR